MHSNRREQQGINLLEVEAKKGNAISQYTFGISLLSANDNQELEAAKWLAKAARQFTSKLPDSLNAAFQHNIEFDLPLNLLQCHLLDNQLRGRELLHFIQYMKQCYYTACQITAATLNASNQHKHFADIIDILNVALQTIHLPGQLETYFNDHNFNEIINNHYVPNACQLIRNYQTFHHHTNDFFLRLISEVNNLKTWVQANEPLFNIGFHLFTTWYDIIQSICKQLPSPPSLADYISAYDKILAHLPKQRPDKLGEFYDRCHQLASLHLTAEPAPTYSPDTLTLPTIIYCKTPPGEPLPTFIPSGSIVNSFPSYCFVNGQPPDPSALSTSSPIPLGQKL